MQILFNKAKGYWTGVGWGPTPVWAKTYSEPEVGSTTPEVETGCDAIFIPRDAASRMSCAGMAVMVARNVIEQEGPYIADFLRQHSTHEVLYEEDSLWQVNGQLVGPFEMLSLLTEALESLDRKSLASISEAELPLHAFPDDFGGLYVVYQTSRK